VNLFRKNSQPKEARKKRFLRGVETSLKSLLLLSFPLPSTILITAIWYFFLYKNNIYFAAGMEGIITAAWIPTFGILYSLLAAVVLNTVWNEYKTIRQAVKRYDVETFIDLRDEEMSPLVHVMVAVLSLAVLGAFMGLKYPNFWSGALLISSTSYLFGLVFWVVVEIDDPCGGIWFIKNIHSEWLEIDPNSWREKRQEHARMMLTKQQ
jgi:hypothetical protein